MRKWVMRFEIARAIETSDQREAQRLYHETLVDLRDNPDLAFSIEGSSLHKDALE